MQQMQPMQQIQQQQQQQIQQNGQNLIWVSGEIGAKSYLMAPNSTVMLMDSESETFYIKTTNNAGMPSYQVFDYKERTQNMPGEQQQQVDMNSQYVTRSEYNALLTKYDQLEKQIKEATQIKEQKETRQKKKVEEVSENE